jgi:cell division protein YceG involved in septum cleavage
VKKIIRITLTAILIGALSAAGSILNYCDMQSGRRRKAPLKTVFTVKPGEGFKSVSQRLSDAGIIHSG